MNRGDATIRGPVLGDFMRHDMAADCLRNGIPPFRSYPPSRLQRLAITIGQRLPHNYAGKRIAGWIRAVVQQAAKSPVDVEVLGMSMRLRLNDNSCERRLLVTPHFFEPDNLKELSGRMKPGFRFVDVGANVGTYALVVAQGGGRSTKVLAIEPNPHLAERLRENAVLNSCHIEIEQVAASDFNGAVTLRRDGNNLGASTLVPHVNVRWPQPPLEVASAKIFDLVVKHGFEHIDAMKLDIEGGEDKALMAFLREAPEHLWPKLLLIEDNAEIWQWDLPSELANRGWSKIASDKNLMLERS